MPVLVLVVWVRKADGKFTSRALKQQSSILSLQYLKVLSLAQSGQVMQLISLIEEEVALGGIIVSPALVASLVELVCRLK